MKNFKNLFAAIALVAVLTLGTSMANAGIIINSFGEDECPTESVAGEKDGIIINSFTRDGIIINSITGIIINSVTGIIINSFGEDEKPCGIIINS